MFWIGWIYGCYQKWVEGNFQSNVQKVETYYCTHSDIRRNQIIGSPCWTRRASGWWQDVSWDACSCRPPAHLPSCLLVFLSHLLCKQGSTLHYKKSRGSSGAISIWSIVGRKVTTACARAALRNMESTNLPITTSLWLRSLVESGMKSISGATIKQTPTARNMKPGAIQTTEPHWHLGSAFHSSCLLLLLVD